MLYINNMLASKSLKCFARDRRDHCIGQVKLFREKLQGSQLMRKCRL